MTGMPPKIISPYSGSNFIPFEGRQSGDGYVIEPKPFPKRMALGMTLGIGLLSAGFLTFVFMQNIATSLKNLSTFPAMIGTFGPAVALWLQSNYHVTRGTLLRYNAVTQSIELPRVGLKLPRKEVKGLAIVRSSDGDIEQLQLHTSAGQAYALISTLDRTSLTKLAEAFGSQIAIAVERSQERRDK